MQMEWLLFGLIFSQFGTYIAPTKIWQPWMTDLIESDDVVNSSTLSDPKQRKKETFNFS
jgi:hypothetical protein